MDALNVLEFSSRTSYRFSSWRATLVLCPWQAQSHDSPLRARIWIDMANGCDVAEQWPYVALFQAWMPFFVLSMSDNSDPCVLVSRRLPSCSIWTTHCPSTTFLVSIIFIHSQLPATFSNFYITRPSLHQSCILQGWPFPF